jgi:hypothetical protein
MISTILKWNHETNHFVPYFDCHSRNGRQNLIINLSDKKYEFMSHVFGGRVLFPAGGWIYYVWETFTMMLGVGEPSEKVKVVIDDVKFLRATALIENHDIIVNITVQRGWFSCNNNNIFR